MRPLQPGAPELGHDGLAAAAAAYLERAGEGVTVTALRVVREERWPFFTPKTLADYLNVSERTVRQMIADQRIDSVRVEGLRRIPADAVDAYVAKHILKAR